MAIAHYLADIFFEIGYLLPQPFETPYQHGRRLLGGLPAEIPMYRVRQELKRMRDRGWITEAKESGKKFYRLTKKGRLEFLYKKLKGAHSSTTGKPWDGKWRLIMFDIPETGRRERDAIRGTLKSIGFYLIQKSVYIYPHAIPDDAISYLKESGLWSYIRFAQIERMENDADAKKYFGFTS